MAKSGAATLICPAVRAPLSCIDDDTETYSSPDVVSDALKVEPLSIVRDSALTSAAVEHETVELCTLRELTAESVLDVAHDDPEIVAS